jgi:hypothetical protein
MAEHLEPERLDLNSLDIATEKQAELLRLFPEIRTEGGKIDFDRLRLALGESVDVGKERYGMNWPGKADCFKAIQRPSLGTLLPVREESVNFDETENLIIEGDNLEVLKLLQKSYQGKVKMIYIDPPYNTGNDFIYPDNYAEDLQTYLAYTGQVDAEGRKFSNNTETDGRFHSKWLEFDTEELVTRAVSAVRAMPKIEQVEVHFTTAELQVTRGGVKGEARAVSTERLAYRGPLPDLLGYLQGQTELTRSTLVRILRGSGRLPDFFLNSQRFMDAVAATLKAELHRLIVDGIKYERISSGDPDFEWQMELFEQEEIINYLTAIQVKRSVYDYVVYDSEVEREFAKRLNEREDIKLFLKLPGRFEIDTPVGKYNPDWAIVKHEDETLYLVRETKSTKDYLKLRTTEADKVRCGGQHFKALDVPFAVVVDDTGV